MRPIEKPGVGDFIARMPEGAREDMLEWADGQSLEAYVGSILEREIPLTDASRAFWRERGRADQERVRQWFAGVGDAEAEALYELLLRLRDGARGAVTASRASTPADRGSRTRSGVRDSR